MAFKVCQQKYNSLINFEPVATTQKELEPNEGQIAEALKEAQRKQFYINLLTK